MNKDEEIHLLIESQKALAESQKATAAGQEAVALNLKTYIESQSAHNAMMIQSQLSTKEDLKSIAEEIKEVAADNAANNKLITQAITEMSANHKISEEWKISNDRRVSSLEETTKSHSKDILLLKNNVTPNTFFRQIVMKVIVYGVPLVLAGAAIGYGYAGKMIQEGLIKPAEQEETKED